MPKLYDVVRGKRYIEAQLFENHKDCRTFPAVDSCRQWTAPDDPAWPCQIAAGQ